ncbi:hypothetical protein [Dyadobacter aurulentus]|uniref:hypothetical protein n=1 Tax=Dyadobacter sp. UC 10 TaxID=2605428 RepID=UPI0011F2A5D6|nr:hypothetical protein [Dyadobacter sp. UC 10]KAA0990917.1 hypothetical protein FXO21_12515 [Dyadobacter sp. UC 10]
MELVNLDKKLVEAAAKSFEASYNMAVGKYRSEVNQLQLAEDEVIAKFVSCQLSYADAKTYIDLLNTIGVEVKDTLVEYVPRIHLRNNRNEVDVVDNRRLVDAETLESQPENTQIEEGVVNDSVPNTEHAGEEVRGDATGGNAKPKRQRGTQGQVFNVIKEQGVLLTTGEIVKLINDWRPGTSYSSITNSLIRLSGELEQLGKIKDDSGANLYGIIDWFNEDGTVKPGHERKEVDSEEIVEDQEELEDEPAGSPSNEDARSKLGLFQ